MSTNDVLEIRLVLNNLIVNSALVSSQLRTLTNLVLGVCKDKLPVDQYENVYTNYVNTLEQMTTEELNVIEGALWGSPAFLSRQRFEALSASQILKEDTAYVSSL